jgi:hypothetical protein
MPFNNAAERALRGLALGRKAWLFAGSDRGGQRAALLYSLSLTAKLNDVDPQAWLADMLAVSPSTLPRRRTAWWQTGVVVRTQAEVDALEQV